MDDNKKIVLPSPQNLAYSPMQQVLKSLEEQIEMTTADIKEVAARDQETIMEAISKGNGFTHPEIARLRELLKNLNQLKDKTYRWIDQQDKHDRYTRNPFPIDIIETLDQLEIVDRASNK